jgi:hypothetical protein
VEAMTKQSRIIDVHHAAATESWLTVYANGRIEYHIENDGYRFLRRGAEARYECINLDHVKAYWPQLIDKVEAALIELSVETLFPFALNQEFRSTPECRDDPGET